MKENKEIDCVHTIVEASQFFNRHYITNCGYILNIPKVDFKFCPFCGKKLKQGKENER